MRDEFLIERHGKTYVLFAGLLDEAHERGLKSIDTELLQVPTFENDNVAICKATVIIADQDVKDPETGRVAGKVFTGIGDASPENVGRAIQPHIIRMSETRAKARALRDACNIAAAALEETGGEEEAQPAAGNVGAPAGSGGTVTDKQARYLKYLVVETGHDLARFVEKHGEPEDLPREKGRQLIERYKGILEGGSGDG